MKQFRRVLAIILGYRLSLVGITFVSAMIAITWGANLGTVYPIFEVVLRGESIHAWSSEHLAEHREQIRAWETQIDEDRAALAALQKGSPEYEAANQALSQAEADLHLQKRTLGWETWLDASIGAYAPTTAMGTLYLVVGCVASASVVRFIFVMIHSHLVTKLVGKTANRLRELYFQRTLRMDMEAFNKHRVADLINRANHDLNWISAGVSNVVGRAITEPMKIAVCLAGAALISWQFLILLMVVVPPIMFTMNKMAKSIRSSSDEIAQRVSDICRRLHLSYIGIQVIKAFNLESAQERKLNQSSRDLLRSSVKHNLINQFAKMLSESFVIAITCVALILGGMMVVTGATSVWGIPLASQPLSAGAMIAFFAFLLGTHQPFRRLSELFSSLQNSEAAAVRFFELVDSQPQVVSPDNPQAFPAEDGPLVLDSVRFAYLPDQPVLKEVSLTLQPGDVLAVVGANGSGKSTMINMICRFYDPDAGRVSFRGVDLKQADLAQYRDLIGLVSQTPVLFDETVEQNIRDGRPGASLKEVVAAAKDAHAHEFITTVLEAGYDTNIGEQGKRLSGGQRQRVALARAILRDPAILILDEPTNAIDLESERKIHDTLRKFMAGRITILVTHHQPSLQLANKIAVMSEGKLVDVGTHEQLVSRCKTYQELFHRPQRLAG